LHRFWLHFGTLFASMSMLLRTLFLTFSFLFRKGCPLGSLCSLWHPFGALWFPFGSHSGPIWLPFGFHLAFIWLPFVGAAWPAERQARIAPRIFSHIFKNYVGKGHYYPALKAQMEQCCCWVANKSMIPETFGHMSNMFDPGSTCSNKSES
jgi:hypothetical protein